MTRPLRIAFAGAHYHVTVRGNNRRKIFLTDEDREDFLAILAKVCKAKNMICHAYCLMGNHFHLLLETVEANISAGMHDINGTYTQHFHRRHQRGGHLFQGRFHCFVIEQETYLHEVARYIVRNPVRAKMVRHPRDWPWSSYRATAGLCRPHEALVIDDILSRFHKHRIEAQRAYRQFIQDGSCDENPFHDSVEGNILGYPQFVDFVWKTNPQAHQIRETPRHERMIGRPLLSTIFATVENQAERNFLVETAYYHCGYTQKEIANKLGVHYSTICKILRNSRFKT